MALRIRSQLLYLVLTIAMALALQLVTHDRRLALPFFAITSAWMASIFMFAAGPLAPWRLVLAVLAQGGILLLFYQLYWSRL